MPKKLRAEKEINHINYALSAKRHTPMYLMHKYWARKPHNVVREYIKAYSNENDVVLDPFCGSGVTLIEAMRCKRKAIAIDLDPVGTFITKMTVMPIDIDELKQAFKVLKENVERI